MKPKVMPEITLHIINALNTIYIVLVTTSNVDVCDTTLNIVKNKKAPHQNSATPNSVFRCVSAPVHNKMYLQDRKILSLSVPATYGKGKYFS